MKNNDFVTDKLKEAEQHIAELKQALEKAAEGDDAKAVVMAQQALNEAQISQKAEEIAQRLIAEQKTFDVERADEQTLAARGFRQLTSEEKAFYQKWSECAASSNPKQALTDANLIFPVTTIESVFEDLRTDHPLLRYINIDFTGAAVKYIIDKNGYQKAKWGKLCDEIVTEAVSGFEVVNTNLYKLSAFIPVCKQLLNLGPAWIDRYVREVLREMYANGITDGMINGTGNDEPIGMRRQVGDDVTVTGGVYPLKDAIVVNDLSPETIGELLGRVVVNPQGGTRVARDVILVVNPVDLYTKVDPALLYRRADGTYARELPWPIAVVDDPAVPVGEAVFGLARRYAALMSTDGDGEGFIDYSDHVQFLQDNRVYLVKGFGNFFPKDNNAFLRLDISGVQSTPTRVTIVDQPGAPAVILSSDIPAETDLLGKSVTDLQTGVVVGGGAIGGTLKYVTGYTGFSGDVSEQSGNYLALHAMSDDGAVIKAKLIGGTTEEKPLDDDGLMIFRVTSTAQSIRITATKNGVSTVRTWALTGLTLTPAG